METRSFERRTSTYQLEIQNRSSELPAGIVIEIAMTLRRLFIYEWLEQSGIVELVIYLGMLFTHNRVRQLSIRRHVVAGSSTRHTRARRQLGNNNKIFPCDWFKGEPLISAPLYLDLLQPSVILQYEHSFIPTNLLIHF